MSLRELIVLGTASQVPTRERNHQACLLRWDGQGYLFDPGEGTQRQLTLAGVPASAIHRILITHFHGDHCLGLASMVQRISLDAVPHPVEVYYPATGQVYFERLLEASIYRHNARIVPRPLDLAGGSFDLGGGFRLEARPLDHVVDTLGYAIREADSLRFVDDRLRERGIAGPQVGQLEREGSIEVEGRIVSREEVSRHRPGGAFAFVMDTRPVPSAVELARGVDLLVAEATFLESEADQALAYGHMTAAQAARLAVEAGARSLLLTHFSQRYRELDGHRREARAIFPAAEVAVDLGRYPLPHPVDGTGRPG